MEPFQQERPRRSISQCFSGFSPKLQPCLSFTRIKVTTGSAGQTCASSPAAHLHLKIFFLEPQKTLMFGAFSVYFPQFRIENGGWGNPDLMLKHLGSIWRRSSFTYILLLARFSLSHLHRPAGFHLFMLRSSLSVYMKVRSACLRLCTPSSDNASIKLSSPQIQRRKQQLDGEAK